MGDVLLNCCLMTGPGVRLILMKLFAGFNGLNIVGKDLFTFPF